MCCGQVQSYKIVSSFKTYCRTGRPITLKIEIDPAINLFCLTTVRMYNLPPVKTRKNSRISKVHAQLQSLEKKSRQRVFCRYNKKVSAKDFLEADDINKKKVSIERDSANV